jgi:hypothetical protein
MEQIHFHEDQKFAVKFGYVTFHLQFFMSHASTNLIGHTLRDVATVESEKCQFNETDPQVLRSNSECEAEQPG